MLDNNKNKELENRAWEQMREQLDQHMPVQTKKRVGFWWIWLGIAVISVSAITMYFSNTDDANESPVHYVDQEVEHAPTINDEDNTVQDQSELNTETTHSQTAKIVERNNQEVVMTPIKPKEQSRGVIIDKRDDVKAETLVTVNDPSELQELITTKKSESKAGNNGTSENTVDNLIEDSGITQMDTVRSSRKSANTRYLDVLASEEKEVEEVDQTQFVESDTEEIEIKDNNKSKDLGELIADEVNQDDPFNTKLAPNTSLQDSLHLASIQEGTEAITKSNDSQFMFGAYAQGSKVLSSKINGLALGLEVRKSWSNWGVNFSAGYENLNSESIENDDLERDVIIPVNNGFNSALQDDDLTPESFLNSAKEVGLQVENIITNQKFIRSELTGSYNLWNGIGLSSGIGYKRLIDISNNEYTFTSDSINLDTQDLPNTVSVGTNYLLINSMTLNKNQWFVPLRLDYYYNDKFRLSASYEMPLTPLFKSGNRVNGQVGLRFSYYL